MDELRPEDSARWQTWRGNYRSNGRRRTLSTKSIGIALMIGVALLLLMRLLATSRTA